MAKTLKRTRYFVLSVVGLVAVVGSLYTANLALGGDAADSDDVDEQADAKKDGEDCEGEDCPQEKAPIPVEAVAAERGEVSAYITTTANLVAENDVRIAAEVDGTVVELHVEEGDWVKEGQVVAMLNRDDAEIAVSKAHARAGNAKLAFDRAQTMREQQVISSEDYDRLSMEMSVANQEVAEAEWGLSKRTIRAPFAGRVTERFAMKGQRVMPNDELFSIADYNPLVARIFLPEKSVLTLNEGREVRIALNADRSIEFAGRIRMISPIVDTATGTVKVTVEAMDPPKQVRPGGFVTINIVQESRDDVVRLPREAVIRELQSVHVFITDGEIATRRDIEIGIEEGDFIEVVSGLEAGERVITAGQGGLREGTKIKVLGDEPAAEAETEKVAESEDQPEVKA